MEEILTEGTIQNYGDNAWDLMTDNPEAAEVALELGLVDMIVTREEIRDYGCLKSFQMKMKINTHFLTAYQFMIILATIEEDEVQNSSKNKIAVVNVEGAIMTGDDAYGVAGSDTIVNNIQSATKDKSVKALVSKS